MNERFRVALLWSPAAVLVLIALVQDVSATMWALVLLFSILASGLAFTRR